MRPPAVSSAKICRNHAGCILWLTGLSGAGKSTVACQLARKLIGAGKSVCILDGDVMRRGLCSDLGFSPEHRRENIRRIGEVAKLFAEAGVICIVALISPYRAERRMARFMVGENQFVEIYVNAPLAICERRDPKGLYAKARQGKIKQFTGISAPYESPNKPEIELRTDRLNVTECVNQVLDYWNTMQALRPFSKS